MITDAQDELGKFASDLVRNWLKKSGYSVFQIDWMGQYFSKEKNDLVDVVFEVKGKGRKWTPPPYYGHGLDIRQVYARMSFYRRTGIRPYFIVWDQEEQCLYGNYIDELEKLPNLYTSPGNIRIYPISHLHRYTAEDTIKLDS